MIAEVTGFFQAPDIQWMPKLTLVFMIGFRPWRQHESRDSWAYLVGKAYLALLMAALLFQTFSLSPAYWFLLAGVHFLWILSAYSIADNHRYLEGYWLLAIAFALNSGSEASAVLAWNARILTGLCFLLAAFWKIREPRYRDGSFFVHSLIFETRFLPVALWIGRLSPEVQHQHQRARSRILDGRSLAESTAVPTRLRQTALGLAWWTIGIEVLLAILFLAPLPNLDLWRVIGLSLFLVSTYAITPVPTFGYILLLMLLAAVEETHLRIFVLGLAVSLLLITELAHFLERKALRRMAEKWKAAAVPLFSWTSRAGSRCLEMDAQSSWRLAFPSVGVSLYAKAEWAEPLRRLLKIDHAFSWPELVGIASGIPKPELNELVTMLTRMKLISYSSPLEGVR